METSKFIIEYKAKGTNKWFSVNHPEFPNEDAAWNWMNTNEKFYLNYDLQLVKITTTKTVLAKA